MSDRNDVENWISQTALGDRKAFDSLYNATSAKLFGVCLRILKNKNEAEDVLQDVYVRIWQKADGYQVNGYSPMTWLITIARNASIDRMRQQRNKTDDLSDHTYLADQAPTPEESAIASSERSRIENCLSELEDMKAEAIRRAYLFGDTYEELANGFDVPLNTMRTWLRRSLLKLRECLTQ